MTQIADDLALSLDRDVVVFIPVPYIGLFLGDSDLLEDQLLLRSTCLRLVDRWGDRRGVVVAAVRT